MTTLIFDVIDVAEYLLGEYGPMATGELYAHLQHHQRWNLTWHETPLFEARIETRVDGSPVLPELQRLLRGRSQVFAGQLPVAQLCSAARIRVTRGGTGTGFGWMLLAPYLWGRTQVERAGRADTLLEAADTARANLYRLVDEALDEIEQDWRPDHIRRGRPMPRPLTRRQPNVRVARHRDTI